MWTAKTLIRLGGWADWVHRSFCWFCHVATHFRIITVITAVISLSKFFMSLLDTQPFCWFCHVTAQLYQEPLTGGIYLSCLMTKRTIRHLRPAKTPISLGIPPVWSASWLSTWRNTGSSTTHRCPGWFGSSQDAQISLLVLSWGGSFCNKLHNLHHK